MAFSLYRCATCFVVVPESFSPPLCILKAYGAAAPLDAKPRDLADTPAWRDLFERVYSDLYAVMKPDVAARYFDLDEPPLALKQTGN